MFRPAPQLLRHARPSRLPSLLSNSANRSIASSARSDDASNPSTLLTAHAIPTNEHETISRISKLMKLGDNLAATAGPSTEPFTMRPSGAWEKATPEPEPVQVKVDELEPLPESRRMQDSYVQLDLRFSQDETLRGQYVGGASKVRMGRLMEDFDGVAGAAAYRHVLPDGAHIDASGKYGFYLVTAAVDRMDCLRPVLNADGSVPDLRLSGHVSFTSASSLEVFCRLSTLPSSPNEEASTILLGRFAMACRSSRGGKFQIAQLQVEGLEEEEMWKLGKEMREGKKIRSSESLEKTPPSAEEAVMLHELFIQRAALFDRQAPTPPNIVFMNDTRLKSAQIMHPQERNMHSKIFGGFLMRMAYETAYSTAALFARSAVTFVALDELQFRAPVEIGSLLILDSRVTYAPMEGQHRSFHVSVEASTIDLATSEKTFTNTFHFTFSSDKPLERHVLPRTYRQSMQWLDAQRRRKVGIEREGDRADGSDAQDASDEGKEMEETELVPVTAAAVALDPTSLQERSREELEKMLLQADSLIRKKEEELSIFTAAGEGLLQEYRSLRDRHDSLLARGTGTTALGSPSRHRRISSSTHATPTPTAPPTRRAWRASLGFPPPAGDSPSSRHHRRTSSNLSFLPTAGPGGETPSAPTSPLASRNITPSYTTFDTSPTTARDRLVSSSSFVSVAPSLSHALTFPLPSAVVPEEISVLTQANYALTVELGELEADSERAEREGRKKLRKLEKELEALRNDLERVEQRNVVLEAEAAGRKERENDLARTVRAQPSAREQTPEVSPTKGAKSDASRYVGFGGKTWRQAMREELGSDAGTDLEEDPSPAQGFASPASSGDISNVSSSFTVFSSPFKSAFLSPRRTPGRGFASSASRSVSSSSLIPLPPPLDLDGSLEAQQDLLVEQLMAKIDELQETNEQILAERTDMVLRLEGVQEEVVEWKERCEELEDEAVQSRLVGSGSHRAIAWHSDGDADADSDIPERPSLRRKTARGPSRRLSSLSSCPPSSSATSTTPQEGTPNPVLSPRRVEKDSLAHELSHDERQDFSCEVSEQRDDTGEGADVSLRSIIFESELGYDASLASPGAAPTDAYDTSLEDEPSSRRIGPLPSLGAPHTPISNDTPPDHPAEGLPSSSLLVLSGGQARQLKQRKGKTRDKSRKKASRNFLSSIHFGSDEEDFASTSAVPGSSPSRRDLALQRLGLEAAARYDTGSDNPTSGDDEDDASSVLSSTYDHLDPTGRSVDYYPLTLRARYHPRMLATMWTDSAARQVVAVVTWVRFLVVLGMALAFALWQGPKKTLGLVDGQRRLR
ncbi:hypothetical protein JCM11641_005119 [Rhodosporidiobolus odoratus]